MKSLIALLVFLSVGSAVAADCFDFVFCWGSVTDEDSARAYAEIGVTDVFASSEKGYAAARKHGLRAYCGFFPSGCHHQELSPAEKKHYDYLNATDLRKQLPKDAFWRKVDERLQECRCQFGGEPVTSPDMCPELITCFLSDTNCVKSKAQMDRTLKANPQAEGIAFDYIGYSNLHSCECADCRARLAAYLRATGLEDTEANRNRFFRAALVDYINTMVDYARGARPGIKVAIHLYPVFFPDPLYGKDLKADYIEETVAWYFQWPDEKISDYARRILAAPHLPGSASVPFVGLNASQGGALAYKSPERLEAELGLILAAGGHQLAVCNGGDMVKPGYREAFRKYCRPKAENGKIRAE